MCTTLHTRVHTCASLQAELLSLQLELACFHFAMAHSVFAQVVCFRALLWLDSDTEEETTPFYDATDLMPDENSLPSLPGAASGKHRVSPIPEPADAASDTTLVADMRHMCAAPCPLCSRLSPL